MLAALTGIDRHESCFAVSKEAPAKVDSFDRGFPTKGVIAGFDHREPTVTPLWSKRNGLKKGLSWQAHRAARTKIKARKKFYPSLQAVQLCTIDDFIALYDGPCPNYINPCHGDGEFVTTDQVKLRFSKRTSRKSF
jgi:hypothetical protein